MVLEANGTKTDDGLRRKVQSKDKMGAYRAKQRPVKTVANGTSIHSVLFEFCKPDTHCKSLLKKDP